MNIADATTATEVIDALADAAIATVEEVNAGRTLTKEQVVSAFTRTFDAALTLFLQKLDTARPELAQRLRRDFLAENAGEFANA